MEFFGRSGRAFVLRIGAIIGLSAGVFVLYLTMINSLPPLIQAIPLEKDPRRA